MDRNQAHVISTGVVLFGGVGLVSIAGATAADGVWSAAVFIGVLGVALLAAGVWGARRNVRCR